jgi:hypothetical protein
MFALSKEFNNHSNKLLVDEKNMEKIDYGKSQY